MARVYHGTEEWAVYHVTTRTLNKQFWLARPQDKHIILQALNFYRKRGDLQLLGYVIMDNHVHFIIQPNTGITIGQVMARFKTWTSKYNTSKTGQTLWERRYDDNVIKSRQELVNVLKYIHLNPVRAGIVIATENYPWSSAHNYLKDGKAMIEIDDDWWQ